MRLGLCAVLGVAAMLWLPASVSRGAEPARAPADPTLAAPDPALMRWALPNGMRVLILPNHTPPGAVSLRFYVRAGADDETEAERGVAHFVEHMAFEGSGRFPADAADKAFADVGVSAVRDQNAFTDAFGTDYVFDLQAATPRKLETALSFLRAAADDLTFEPAALERERPVILAEISARRSGGSALSEFVSRFFAPLLLPPRRTPGGSPESVSALTAADLRRFHDRWYRPERTTLIVVGDVDPAAVHEQVARLFGDWRGKGPAPASTDIGQVDPKRPAAALAVTTPNFAQGSLQICRVAPRDPPLQPGQAAITREALDAIWLSALQERLARLARAPDAPFDTATAGRTEAFHAASLTCASAEPKAGRWQETVTALVTENRRLDRYGVQPPEAERALAALSARFDENRAAASTRSTDSLARVLLALEIDGTTFTTPAELSRVFALARPTLTPEAASDAFRRRLEGPRVTVLASTTPVSTDQLNAALDAAVAAPAPAPPVVPATATWPYTDFGPKGRVTLRQEIADPAFTRFTFANGVVLNFKRTTFQEGAVVMRVSFGAGQPEVPRALETAAVAGVGAIGDGGLGRLDADQLQTALRGRIWNLSMGMDRNDFSLTAGTRPADLLTQLQVAAAALTDPGFRPEQARRIPSMARSLYKENAIQPVRAASLAIAQALPAPHPYDLPPQAEFAAVNASQMAAALKPSMLHDALEVTLVGDVDEAQAVDAVARTLGALPPRTPRWSPPADAPITRYGSPPAEPLQAPHIGLKEKAAVVVSWPLYIWAPERLRETRALTLLRELMGSELRREVRERMGLTYTPAIEMSLQRGRDQGAMTVAVETSPAKVEAVRLAILDLGRRLAAPEGVDPARLEEVRKPLLDDTAHRKETNAWWVATLDGSAHNPFQLEMARTWQHDYATLPASEVQAAATRWLSGRPWVAISTPAPDAPAAPAEAAPVTPVPPSVPPPVAAPAAPAAR